MELFLYVPAFESHRSRCCHPWCCFNHSSSFFIRDVKSRKQRICGLTIKDVSAGHPFSILTTEYPASHHQSRNTPQFYKWESNVLEYHFSPLIKCKQFLQFSNYFLLLFISFFLPNFSIKM